jgi:multiple sugar transport system ATP-binding protein
MTVFDNMAFGLKIGKKPAEERDKSFMLQKHSNKLVNWLILNFGKTLKEERDKNGNIVTDENGNVKYVVKKGKDGTDRVDKDGKPIYAKRRYTDEERLGRIVFDESGHPVLIPKTYGRDITERITKKDENGKPVVDIIEHKQGEIVRDKNGEIVYKMRKYTKEEIYNKVMEAAEILDITQFLDRKPKAMSGGQRQRVAIGRSIVRKPKVFLMDEPLSNLDAKLRNQMRSEILLLRKRINTTFIYVTHDQTEAMTLGDRIVIMRNGVIQQIGTPTDVFDHPANLFVAGFIGSPQMNFFDAELIKNDDKYSVDLLGTKFELSEEQNAQLMANKTKVGAIVLGIRPEHFTISEKKETYNVETKVTVNEMMGSELYVHCNMTDNRDIIVRTPTIGLSDKIRLAIKDMGNLYLSFVPEVMHLFDKESEASLLPLQAQ